MLASASVTTPFGSLLAASSDLSNPPKSFFLSWLHLLISDLSLNLNWRFKAPMYRFLSLSVCFSALCLPCGFCNDAAALTLVTPGVKLSICLVLVRMMLKRQAMNKKKRMDVFYNKKPATLLNQYCFIQLIHWTFDNNWVDTLFGQRISWFAAQGLLHRLECVYCNCVRLFRSIKAGSYHHDIDAS